MSVQTQIDRILRNVSDTYSALEEAGADMPAVRNTNNLAGTVASIRAAAALPRAEEASF